jgi:hypothetical protein
MTNKQDELLPEGEWKALPKHIEYKGEKFRLVSVNYGTTSDIGLKLTRYVNDASLGGFTIKAEDDPRPTPSDEVKRLEERCSQLESTLTELLDLYEANLHWGKAITRARELLPAALSHKEKAE